MSTFVETRTKSPARIDERGILVDSLCDKVHNEYELYISQLKTKSPEEIIERAYEIVTYDEMINVIDTESANEHAFPLEALRGLNALDRPLASCYDEWISSSFDGIDKMNQLRACMTENGMFVAKI